MKCTYTVVKNENMGSSGLDDNKVFDKDLISENLANRKRMEIAYCQWLQKYFLDIFNCGSLKLRCRD